MDELVILDWGRPHEQELGYIRLDDIRLMRTKNILSPERDYTGMLKNAYAFVSEDGDDRWFGGPFLAAPDEDEWYQSEHFEKNIKSFDGTHYLVHRPTKLTRPVAFSLDGFQFELVQTPNQKLGLQRSRYRKPDMRANDVTYAVVRDWMHSRDYPTPVNISNVGSISTLELLANSSPLFHVDATQFLEYISPLLGYEHNAFKRLLNDAKKHVDSTDPAAQKTPPLEVHGPLLRTAIELVQKIVRPDGTIRKRNQEVFRECRKQGVTNPYSIIWRMQDFSGVTLGKYYILGKLAKGSSSTVYEATDEIERRLLLKSHALQFDPQALAATVNTAVKIMNPPTEDELMKILASDMQSAPSSPPSPNELPHDEQERLDKLRKLTAEGLEGRFLSDVRNLKQLSHENLARIWDHGIEGSNNEIMYIGMPFYRKGSLEQHLGKLDFVDAAKKILAGLSYLHAPKEMPGSNGRMEKVRHVHRDIKPSNILLTDDEHLIVLGDMQSVKDLKKIDPNATSFTHGWQHAAPQQRFFNVTGFQEDIFSAGCTFFRMLTQKPFILDYAHGIIRVNKDKYTVLLTPEFADAFPPPGKIKRDPDKGVFVRFDSMSAFDDYLIEPHNAEIREKLKELPTSVVDDIPGIHDFLFSSLRYERDERFQDAIEMLAEFESITHKPDEEKDLLLLQKMFAPSGGLEYVRRLLQRS